jgi:hypothetical protein
MFLSSRHTKMADGYDFLHVAGNGFKYEMKVAGMGVRE